MLLLVDGGSGSTLRCTPGVTAGPVLEAALRLANASRSAILLSTACREAAAALLPELMSDMGGPLLLLLAVLRPRAPVGCDDDDEAAAETTPGAEAGALDLPALALRLASASRSA